MNDKIISILVKICGTDEIKTNMDLNLFEAGLLDSLGFIELLVAVEREFNIDIEPTEVQREDVETVNKIIEFVKGKKG